MSFRNINFILVRPQLPENIGACARALKNFDFNNFSLVQPKKSWLNEKAIATSVGAKDILKSVKVYNTLEDAVSKLHVTVAMTSRIRKTNKKFITLKDFFLKNNKKKKIGFVFGAESSGLSNKETSQANYLIKIPTNPNFESINLSHSVILICYEIFSLFKKSNIFFKSTYRSDIAKKSTVNLFIKRLVKTLDQIGFLQPDHKRQSMLININNIFHRFDLSEQELHILQGIFTNLYRRKKVKG